MLPISDSNKHSGHNPRLALTRPGQVLKLIKAQNHLRFQVLRPKIILSTTVTNDHHMGLFDEKIWKNANDLHDLDFDLVTLRSPGYVDLDYTYL